MAPPPPSSTPFDPTTDFLRHHHPLPSPLPPSGVTQTFLLEKIRVVKQSYLERNYHIFYIITAGANAKERARWHLKPSQGYYYTNQSECYDR